MSKTLNISVIGAGPAGLTAAYWLSTRYRTRCDLYEATESVGGISRTVEAEGWRFDIGGHRFFTKVSVINEIWNEILVEEQFLTRPRISRIYYDSKFYDYPLKPLNALRNLGVMEAVLCIFSYFLTQVTMRASKRNESFESLVASKFGWRLYEKFFKTYTEKVWGVPANKIGSEWAQQRIKSLNLFKAILDAFGIKRSNVTSLIEEFRYPKFGPGQMWENCLSRIIESGSNFFPNAKLVGLQRLENGELLQEFSDGKKSIVTTLISSMPINELISIIKFPEVPSEVRAAATGLKHRDFLTVALVVPEKGAFPDNWIYIHSPDVRVGRIQNYHNWSPHMSAFPGWVCLGMEYFVNKDDDLWNSQDEELIKLATSELLDLGLIARAEVMKGFVIRVEKAYPVYDQDFKVNLGIVREWLSEQFSNVYPIGRNGMHTYNNQDHSMLTAILTVENIITESKNNVWAVNTENEYHEAGLVTSKTGRDAPIQRY